MKKIDKRLENMKNKVMKQNILIGDSTFIIRDLILKINELDNRIKLLEVKK